MLLNTICWIVLGLIIGFILSRVTDGRRHGVFVDSIVAVVGALIGGWMFHQFGRNGLAGLNLWGLVGATGCAWAIVTAWHALRGPIIQSR